MIDDDFESVFRRMFEHFMETMGFQEGEAGTRRWSGFFPSADAEMRQDVSMENPEVETIDLGESYLILADMNGLAAEPRVRVRGREVELAYRSDRAPQIFQVPFDIDLGRSGSSYHNGIVEVVLVRASPEYEGDREGYLHME